MVSKRVLRDFYEYRRVTQALLDGSIGVYRDMSEGFKIMLSVYAPNIQDMAPDSKADHGDGRFG